MVELLLADPRVGGAPGTSSALFMAAQSGRLDILERLLADPRVDPAADGLAAMHAAARGAHCGVLERLLAEPRVDSALKRLRPARTSALAFAAVRTLDFYERPLPLSLLHAAVRAPPAVVSRAEVVSLKPDSTVRHIASAAWSRRRAAVLARAAARLLTASPGELGRSAPTGLMLSSYT